MAYYLHIEACDYESESYDDNGDSYSYTTVYWHGPFEFKGEALDWAVGAGYHKTNTEITIIEFRG